MEKSRGAYSPACGVQDHQHSESDLTLNAQRVRRAAQSTIRGAASLYEIECAVLLPKMSLPSVLLAVLLSVLLAALLAVLLAVLPALLLPVSPWQVRLCLRPPPGLLIPLLEMPNPSSLPPPPSLSPCPLLPSPSMLILPLPPSLLSPWTPRQYYGRVRNVLAC